MIALLLAFAVEQRLLQTRGPVPAPIPVQQGVTVTPDTVTVGQPFRVVVRVHAPRGATIAFPPGPDSGATVEAIDPRIVRDNRDTAAVDQSVTYRLAAWDIEWQPLRLGDIVVRMGNRERHIALADLRVFVRSVLPADTAKRVPKPPRALMEFPQPWWMWLLAALIVLALVGLFLWWWWRRRRRIGDDAERDPYEVATERFDRVEKLALIEAGERGRHAALMVDVLRDYLVRVLSGVKASLTTTELIAALRDEPRVPSNRLAAILAETDLVKFAARPVSADRARELGQDARNIAAAVHEQLTAAEGVREEAA